MNNEKLEAELKEEINIILKRVHDRDQEIQKLTLRLERAEEVIGFYGNEDHWDYCSHDTVKAMDESEDYEFKQFGKEMAHVAGKKAREYFKNKDKE